MPDKKTGRDFPLAPTSIPKAIDNTYVSRRPIIHKELYPSKPDYSFKYSNENYTKKDSADYKEGYSKGIRDVSNNPEGKGLLFGKFKRDDYRMRHLYNDKLNAGYNEGINKVLDRIDQKKKKK